MGWMAPRAMMRSGGGSGILPPRSSDGFRAMNWSTNSSMSIRSLVGEHPSTILLATGLTGLCPGRGGSPRPRVVFAAPRRPRVNRANVGQPASKIPPCGGRQDK